MDFRTGWLVDFVLFLSLHYLFLQLFYFCLVVRSLQLPLLLFLLVTLEQYLHPFVYSIQPFTLAIPPILRHHHTGVEGDDFDIVLVLYLFFDGTVGSLMSHIGRVLGVSNTVIMGLGNRPRFIMFLLIGILIIRMRVLVIVLGDGSQLVVIFVFLGGGVVGVMAGCQCDQFRFLLIAQPHPHVGHTGNHHTILVLEQLLLRGHGPDILISSHLQLHLRIQFPITNIYDAADILRTGEKRHILTIIVGVIDNTGTVINLKMLHIFRVVFLFLFLFLTAAFFIRYFEICGSGAILSSFGILEQLFVGVTGFVYLPDTLCAGVLLHVVTALCCHYCYYFN